MTDGTGSESPLENVTDKARATEAFKILGNETRLAILVALWESYDPSDTDNTVPFSDLRKRVGTADSGRFNYHLDQLDGQFVTSDADGYELQEAGLKFVRTVIAGAGIEDPTLEPTEIEMTCNLCGAPVEVLYEDGWIYNRCTECDGLWSNSADYSKGHLSKLSLDPAGLTGRSPSEMYAAAWVRGFNKLYTMLEGVCSTCSGPVERSLDVCDTHETDGLCSTCGRHRQIIVRLRCAVCKEWGQMSLGVVARYHPAIVAFYYDHGLPLQYGFNDLERINRLLETGSAEVEVVSEDPLRVGVTLTIDDDDAWLEFDEDVAVVDIET